MTTLVFDIETVGETWESLDETTQTVLSRTVSKRMKDTVEKEDVYSEIKEHLAFSPLTGKIVAIGLYDRKRKQGAVYYTGLGNECDVVHGEYVFKQRSEEEMLSDFWEGAKSYDTFVTFNGRGFDVPFLLHRSVVHHIVPTRVLMEGRYLYQQQAVHHIDLQDQLTFYGAGLGKPSLHLFCRAYGIASPYTHKIGSGDITKLFMLQKFHDIAEHNARKVTATSALYEKWLTYVKPATVTDEIS